MIPNTKVFVGSLPAGSKPEELRRLFEAFGVVTECDIMNKCGFVWMQTEEMAQSAIASLNNTMFKGQPIVVEPGRIKDRGQKRQGGGSGSGRSGGPRGGGFQRGGGGGNRMDRQGGGGGPMRRGRDGPMRRSGPYGGGGGAPGGGRSDFGNRGRSDIDRMAPMPPPPAFGGGVFDGFSNEDRRGFALPNQYDNAGPQQRGFQRNSGPRQGGFGGGAGFNRNDGGFNRNEGGGFNRNDGGRPGGGYDRGGPNPSFNRGPGNQGGGGNFGGRPNQGNGNSAYNQQFPPLGGGAGGGSFPRRGFNGKIS
uniref:CSON006603 protein n=1 Tax=Culicoides sonorensis TaxID=179676 RepID=A0A336LWL0_CULSO